MDAPPRQATIDDAELLRRAGEAMGRVREQIGRVVIGQEETVTALLTAVLAGGHVLVVGVPGLAKTLLVKTLAGALGWRFSRVQFTPDMMPADIIGMELLSEGEPDERGYRRRRMEFVPGPIFANLVLADEINRTPPKTQAALLEAMQERQVTSLGRVHPLEPPFVVVATQNPIEQEGTYPLPEAQLDRFMFSLWMGYPGEAEERRIVAETTRPRDERVSAVLGARELLAYQALVRRVPVGRHVVGYAVAVARATRPGQGDAEGKNIKSEISDYVDQYVEWGAGPRAGQQMVLGGKALAVIEGAAAVTCEHIRQVAPHVLRHRVLPNYQAAGEGIDAAGVVGRVVENVAEDRM